MEDLADIPSDIYAIGTQVGLDFHFLILAFFWNFKDNDASQKGLSSNWNDYYKNTYPLHIMSVMSTIQLENCLFHREIRWSSKTLQK